MTITPEEFEQEVKTFEPLTSKQALAQLDADDEKLIFVGRPTCPYCRKFLPKLKNVVDKNNFKVYYLDSTDTPTDSDLAKFRETLGIRTVPGLAYAGGQKGNENLGADSSWSEEKISQAIQSR